MNDKKSTINVDYVKEMDIWLKQQEILKVSCEKSIESRKKEIAINLKLMALDYQRIRLIQHSIRMGQKELKDYKKRHKKK